MIPCLPKRARGRACKQSGRGKFVGVSYALVRRRRPRAHVRTYRLAFLERVTIHGSMQYLTALNHRSAMPHSTECLCCALILVHGPYGAQVDAARMDSSKHKEVRSRPFTKNTANRPCTQLTYLLDAFFTAIEQFRTNWQQLSAGLGASMMRSSSGTKSSAALQSKRSR